MNDPVASIVAPFREMLAKLRALHDAGHTLDHEALGLMHDELTALAYDVTKRRNDTALPFKVGDRVSVGMTQEEAEAAAYSAINEFIMCRNRNCIPVMLTADGLAEIAGVAQHALGDGWVVTAAKPDIDWSREPAVTVRAVSGPAASRRPSLAPTR